MSRTPTDPDVSAIERTVDLAAAPERVWSALTDETQLGTWFSDQASFRPEPGATGWLDWAAHGRFAVRVELVEAFRAISWRWARDAGRSIEDGPSTLVELRIEPRPGGGTRLHLRESGFATAADRTRNSTGWVEELGDLLAHLARAPFEAGIRRVYHLTSAPERVWAAFSDADRLRAWWGGTGHLEVRAGFQGWWEWPGMGRFGMAFDAVEPMSYLAWRWTTVAEVPVEDADQVLRTEWALVPRSDGGTDLRLLETGFTKPDDHRMNDGGWDGDVLPTLRRVLGEAP